MKPAFWRVLDRFGLGRVARDAVARLRYRRDRTLRRSNARLASRPGPDGLPLPPPRLVYAVSNSFDVEAFFRDGERAARSLAALLERNGVEIASARAILDFGCGCGRILRHWKGCRATEVHGTDANPRLVAWCRDNLTFARFEVNGLVPPLDLPASHFDVALAASVFTHLPVDLQMRWLDELARVIRPGGVLVATLMGRGYQQVLRPDEARLFDRGEVVVRQGWLAGSNHCAVFHPEVWVRRHFGDCLPVVDIEPMADIAGVQDAFVMRKPFGENAACV